MTNAVNQADIDALLDHVGNDAPSTETSDWGMDSLPSSSVEVYDFRNPRRVHEEQIELLEHVHEAFAHAFSGTLTGLLRASTTLRVEGIEQASYGHFIESLPNPTHVGAITATPLEGRFCLDLSPKIAYPMIDRLLGGAHREAYIPQRPMSAIEFRLLRRLTDQAMRDLSQAWSDLGAVTFEAQAAQSNPRKLQIAPPNESVLVVFFTIRLGPQAGRMSLCLPLRTIEPLLSTHGRRKWVKSPPTPGSPSPLQRDIGAARVELKAYLTETSLTMEDLLKLQPGDLIQTGKSTRAEVILRVNDQNVFAGRVGRHKNNLAIKITRRASADESP